MTKTLNLIQDTVHNPKHSFRQAENRPAKAQKNRYERRKIREFLRLGDWSPGAGSLNKFANKVCTPQARAAFSPQTQPALGGFFPFVIVIIIVTAISGSKGASGFDFRCHQNIP